VAGDLDAVLAERGHPDLDLLEHLVAGEPGLGLQQRALVVVGEQVFGAADQGQHVAAVHPGELLRRVGGELEAAGAALLRVPDHGRRVVRADQDQIEAAGPLVHRRQLDVAGLGHRPGVERGDLVEVVIGGADEAGRVGHLADVHRTAVDVVPLEPGPVVGEVGTHRADQDRAQAELAHAERDVAGHAAAPDHQVVDEEGQRDLVQLVGDELVGEPAREVHQVVGGDRAGDGDLHGGPCSLGNRGSLRTQPTGR
jgi:hypothetical protein